MGTLTSLDGAGRSYKPQPLLGASRGILAAPGRGKEIAPCMGSCVRGGVAAADARGRQIGCFFPVEGLPPELGVVKFRADGSTEVHLERWVPCEVKGAAATHPHPPRCSGSAQELFIHKKDQTLRGASESEPQPLTRTLPNIQPRACTETSGNRDRAPGLAARTVAPRSPRKRRHRQSSSR